MEKNYLKKYLKQIQNRPSSRGGGLNHMHRMLMMTIALLMLCSTKAWAADANARDVLNANTATITFEYVEQNNNNGGCVDFDILYGYDPNGQFNGWFYGGKKEMHVLFGGEYQPIFAFENDKNQSIGSWPPPKLVQRDPDNSWAKIIQSYAVGNVMHMTVRWYFKGNRYINKNLNFKYFASIEQDNDGADAYQSEYTFPNKLLIKGISNFSTPTSDFHERFQFKVTSTSNTDVPLGTTYHFAGDGDRAVSGKTIEKIFGRSPSAQTGTLNIGKYYSSLSILNETKEFVIPGYQDIVNGSVRAIYDSSGKVTLYWKLEPGNGARIGDDGKDKFVIRRADNPDFTNATELRRIAVDVNKTDEFSIVDDNLPSYVQGTLYYRVTREKTLDIPNWGWDYGRGTSIQVDSKHVEIMTATAELSRNEGGTQVAKIKWSVNNINNIWSNNSKFVIVRNNLTTGTPQEISGLTKNELAAGTYTDNAIQTCNQYSYQIYVLPGDENYKAKKFTTDIISPSEIGEMVSVTTSKGYFSDRVDIAWESKGMFESFSIKRKLYGSTDEYKQILSVNGSSAMNNYNAEDKNCIPGEVYQYQIVGIVLCTDKILSSNGVEDIGFRTPTGDIYGRVTYDKSGQAVSNVEVRAEVTEDTDANGKSYQFNRDDVLTIDNKDLLKSSLDSITIQAWVNLKNNGTILKKSGMYELSIINEKATFKVGTQVLTAKMNFTNDMGATLNYKHLSAVADKDSLYIYVNGKQTDRVKRTAVVTANANAVTIGGDGFIGNIDEVRIWNKALDAKVITRDYSRYLTGGELGLLAYYTFDYSVNKWFYDTSFSGTKYNGNHGTVTGATINNKNIPTADQLGYKGVTALDGSYAIRALPYSGNGTTYIIVPRLGIHKFESEKELRLIGSNSQSHTVNFTDKSSFLVSGRITYKGGTIPVQGVSFKIDGVTAMGNKANILVTNAQGEFEIQVPVGTHEVKAVKNNHKFEYDGRILTSDLLDRNYQDMLTGLELVDITTVRYIGRVAGGTIQEAYPIGHSLSTNNLGNSVSVTLTYSNPAYAISSKDTTVTVNHFKPSNKTQANNNRVIYSNTMITIYPNIVTGEFIADVLPETFNVAVNAPGYDDNVKGLGGQMDLSSSFADNVSSYDYTDSVEVKGQWVRTNYSDSVHFNKKQIFAVRVAPKIDLVQLDAGNKPLPYFGEKKAKKLGIIGFEEVLLYNEENNTYAIGRPAFEQSNIYNLRATVFEDYNYYDENGQVLAGQPKNIVPAEDAIVEFAIGMAKETNPIAVTADKKGVAIHSFQCGEPDLSSAVAAITVKAKIGGETGTSFDWVDTNNLLTQAVVLGHHMNGTNFVTAGPDKLMMVLRDPPGSNSYSFLEKGATVSRRSVYTGNITNVGSENFTQKLGAEITTFTGIGAGTINSSTVSSDLGLAVNHEETVGGSSERESVTTTTTRFQTSDNPSYVGAGGDVFIGYSTNISFGSTESVNFVSREKYEKTKTQVADFYKTYEAITPVTNDMILVKQQAIGVAQNFGTLFAYPQSHIENTLIPEIRKLKASFLHPKDELNDAQAQILANQNKVAVYCSLLASDDKNYGKSNTDPVFKYTGDIAKGPSYKIFYPETQKVMNDTISYFNQSIDAWIARMRDNEKAKIEAVKLQNYSFHAGSPIEYSESFSKTSTETTNFNLLIGVTITNETDALVFGNGFNLQISEEITTSQGGEFSTTEEASHSKGFVLAEDGNDYISVDVCREKEETEGVSEKKSYSTFIFKTKAGATSCPYEGEYKTTYYEPGTQIDASTVQIEKPVIDVKEGQDFINNVPSGAPAYITLYLKNASELNEDGWYNLKIIDGSNPNGAKLYMDGAAIGNGRALLVPAGEILVKTLEVSKGSIMNYDNLQLSLESQCQSDIADTVTFSVHFTPSCTDVNIKKPTDNWTYNTKLKTIEKAGITKHFMEVVLDGFDVNYDNFSRIKLQYKSSSKSDEDWITLMSYYKDSTDYKAAIAHDENAAAEVINAKLNGTINYKWVLDDMQDQRYDLRAVGVCVINNNEVENASSVHSGIKDMYTPRLFGSAQPANGILTLNDEVRLNFNEKIAEGFLTKDNFQVVGIRNGLLTDRSVAVRLDGSNDRLTSEFTRNWANKDLTIEMWVFSDKPQDATYFSQGNVNESMEFGITADNHLRVKIGSNQIISDDPVLYEQGNWAHVSFVLNAKENKVNAYYNFKEYISGVSVNPYAGEGNYMFGASINGGGNFAGMMDNARIWDNVISAIRIEVNSDKLLSGAENNLLAYYPMDEAKGSELKDKARGANLSMNGSEWALPEGRAAMFNGTTQYVRLNTTGGTEIDQTMDYTMEFWFKGEAGQSNATLVSNGRGDGLEAKGSRNLFSIGFEDAVLTYHSNGVKAIVDGNYLDNDWHHLALTVSRTNGRAQILVDGILKTFFEAQDLGGVSAPYMYLGARGWTSVENNSTVTIDNFFKGEIDEFRLWNLYKSESIVNISNSEHLDGKEMGLLAYYPFDYYIDVQGTKELDFTLSDMKEQKDLSEKVKDAEAFGGNVETSASAPIKDKGPVSKLSYDFVVNNDALIINFHNDEWQRIEKSIVTFTVEGVSDMNGNKLSSPVTWSAYIDHNQLKWSENEISIEKPTDVEKTFVVKAVNHGGSVQRFDMENMPSWLNVEPMSGTIKPSSSLEITFTVDAGLNIGSYNEIVYMRNENNASEAIAVNVKVKGEKPNWNVNPANYKYNMSVFGKLSVNRTYSIDKEDLLAAFYKGTCVGVVNNSYSKENDMYYALLTVYSNEAATGELEFRIWDASTGAIYNARPTNAINFSNNKVVGSPTKPIVFTAQDLRVQQLPLNSGWNWVSFNVVNNTLNDINATLGNNVWSKNDIVKSEMGGFASYSENGWVGSLTGFDNTSMYMIQSEKSQRIDLTGTLANTQQTKLNILGSKNDGTTLWNYISYLPAINLTLKEALAGYPAIEGDVIKSQNKFAMYTGNTGWIGSLSNMESGKGYMLQRNAQGNVELQYPNVSSNGRLKVKTKVNQTEEEYINANYANNMTMIARIVGIDVQTNDKLIAYVAGEKRGESSVIRIPGTNNDLFFLTIAGDKAENISVALESNGKTVASSEEVATYANNQTKGTLAQPMLIDLSKNAKDANIYPSPFDEVLNIKLNVEKDAEVNITITDTQGRLIDNFKGYNKDGNVSIEWKGAAHLTSGIYMVNIVIDHVKSVYKVIKK